MKRVAAVLGGLAWFALVFFVTWRITFPSQAVGDRIKVEVHKATGGAFDLAVSDLVPWWLGAKASNVVLYQVKRGEKSPVFAFEAARLRAGPFSLIRNEPRVLGAVQIGSSELEYDVTVAMNKRGTELVPRVVNITADAFPVQDLAGLAGATIEASGGLDLEVEVEAGEKGMRDAIGDVKISGRDILIAALDPSLTGGMDLGMEIPLDEVDIHFEIENGKADLRTGKIRSSLVDAELEGDITLREDLSRSTLGLEVALELGEELEMFKSFIKRAEWADGSFHYKCSGTLGRPSCRENPERGGARASRNRNRNGSRPSRTARGSNANKRKARSSLSDEERDKRREEALARLRSARERRAGGDRLDPDAEDLPPDDEGDLEDLGYEDGEEGEFDEELPPEELPPGDEIGVEELVPEDF